MHLIASYCILLQRVRPHIQRQNIKDSGFFSKKNNINMADLSPILLNGSNVQYTDKISYFGATIVSKKGVAFSSSQDLIKFYRSSNSVLTANNKPSKEVLIRLLYSCCIPILLYASAVKEYPSREMQSCCTVRQLKRPKVKHWLSPILP